MLMYIPTASHDCEMIRFYHDPWLLLTAPFMKARIPDTTMRPDAIDFAEDRRTVGAKTGADRQGSATLLRARDFGTERVEAARTENGYIRVRWIRRRTWLGADPMAAKETYQRWCVQAWLLHWLNGL